MTLLELLVKELPKRGGWVGIFKTDRNWDVVEKFIENYKLSYGVDSIFNQYVESEETGEIVTREQYEAAIAAKQPVWDGEGLPPVGCECELVNFYGNDFPEFVGEHGEEVKIIGRGFTNGCPVAFYEADGGRGGMLAYAVEQCFRPIRTEAERKRDIAVGAMEKSWEAATDKPAHDFESIYGAIASGKIPGVEISK